MNFYLLEHLARVLCDAHGGKWSARKHKRNHWRARVLELIGIED